MTSPRKKPGVAFWATVVVVVLAAYPVSFGPACWLDSRIDTQTVDIGIPYGPLLSALEYVPGSQDLLRPYAACGMKPGTWMRFRRGDRVVLFVERR